MTEGLRSTAGLQALLDVPGIGPRTALQIALEIPDLESLRELDESQLAHRFGKRAGAALHVSPPRLANSDTGSPPDWWALGYFDDDYPVGFRDLNDPPPIVWGKGERPVSGGVAIVGTREPTQWSLDVTARTATSAATEGHQVVSGLALGTDAAAHQACLDAGGATTAILGNGIDTVYPSKHRDLAARILESGGCLLSEVPPGTRVSGKTLVGRDRLQAALAEATIVIQSGIPGGTLHTARFTIELSRPLVVMLPGGDIDTDRYAGNLALSDPDGCDPAVLKAEGRVAELVRKRRPAADLVVSSAAQLPALWSHIGRWTSERGPGWKATNGSGSSSSTSTEPSPTLPI